MVNAPVTGKPTRYCPRCSEHKTLDSFPLDTRGDRNGRYGYCLPCKRDYMREYRRRDPEAARVKQFRDNIKRYGVTPEEFHKQNAEQNGCCAICGGPPTGNHGRLAIDHCHVTGRYRGLLCGNCNSGLGVFRDNPTLLFAAARYLLEGGAVSKAT